MKPKRLSLHEKMTQSGADRMATKKAAKLKIQISDIGFEMSPRLTRLIIFFLLCLVATTLLFAVTCVCTAQCVPASAFE